MPKVLAFEREDSYETKAAAQHFHARLATLPSRRASPQLLPCCKNYRAEDIDISEPAAVIQSPGKTRSFRNA